MSDPSSSAPANAVESRLLGGRIRLMQPERGYRAGMDAALLAAAVEARPGERLIEAGCGAGAVLMQVARRRPGVSLTGLEREADAAGLARWNATMNSAPAEIISGDVSAGFRALERHRFDWAVSNPPFFDDVNALRAPAEGKRAAWIADDGLKAWTDFLLAATKDGGRIVVIHRADRLADLLALLGAKAGSFIYKMLDRVTGEVVRQLPREEVVNLAAHSGYGSGAVIDTRA